MVTGFDSFKKWFEGYEEQFTIIGGTACDLLMTEEGMDFRATKDVDMVLILEAITPAFGKRLWDYIVMGKYEHRDRSNGTPQFYRFTKPETSDFPAMIELFSRRADAIDLPKDATLTPLPVDEDISSLSAILLDGDYYAFLKNGRRIVEGVAVLDAAHLIPFKAKAWLDLSDRKKRGEQVDSRHIRKHKNDVFRLTELLTVARHIEAPATVVSDVAEFVAGMSDETVDLKQLGIVGRTKQEILTELRQLYVCD